MQQLFFKNILYKSSVFTSKKLATFKLIPYTLIYIERKAIKQTNSNYSKKTVLNIPFNYFFYYFYSVIIKSVGRRSSWTMFITVFIIRLCANRGKQNF